MPRVAIAARTTDAGAQTGRKAEMQVRSGFPHPLHSRAMGPAIFRVAAYLIATTIECGPVRCWT